MVKSKWQSSLNNTIGNRAGLMLMTLVLLLAFALGANSLNADVIWIDELHSVLNMGVFNPPYSPFQIVESLRQYVSDHVPLYFFLGAFWAQIAGWSQFALRLLSCFFGVLMLAWLYRFAADAVNRRTAVTAVLLMSTTAFVVLHFHELRMYTMLMCLGIVHSWLYWRLAHNFRITRLTWILFILTTSLLFYTHNFSTVLFAGVGIHHLLFVKKSRRWLHIIIGWVLGAVLLLPYVPFVLEGFSHHFSHNFPTSTLKVAGAFAHLMVNGFDFLWLLLMLSFGYALWRRRNAAVLRLMCIALIMAAVLLAAQWQFKFFRITRIRYFLISWFPFVILFAWGLTSVPHWRLVTALFLLLWGIAGYQLGQPTKIVNYSLTNSVYLSYPPLHEYVYLLKDKVRSTDYLVGYTGSRRVNRKTMYAVYGWSTAAYYLEGQLGIDGKFIEKSYKGAEFEKTMKTIMDNHPYLLFAYDPGEDRPPNLDAALDIIHKDFIPCDVLVNEPDLLVQRYVNQVVDCDHQPAPIAYDNGIKVIDRFVRYVPESEVLQILTGWEAAAGDWLDPYTVSLQIITSDWRNVRQIDRRLYDNWLPWDALLLPWNVLELSTEGLPPGDYQLMLILYNRDSGEKMSGLDLTSGEAGNILPLLSFTIES